MKPLPTENVLLAKSVEEPMLEERLVELERQIRGLRHRIETLEEEVLGE